MKAFFCAAICILLTNIAIAKDQKLTADHFSIIVPNDMIADEKKADYISLVFKGDEDKLQKGTLTISAMQSDKLGNFEVRWTKYRNAITHNRIVLYEREEEIKGLKWKIISFSNKVGCIFQEVVYYSRSANVIYTIYYQCQQDNCGPIQAAFSNILTSFQWSSK